MSVDDVFQLRGVHIITGGNDHPLDALAEIYEAVLVHEAQVAGMEPHPAVKVPPEGLGRLGGIIHVAKHDGGTGHANLALGVGFHFLGSAHLDDFIIGIREGYADGTGTGIVLGGQAGSGDAFGGAIALPDLLGAAVLLQESIYLLLQFRGQAVAAGENTLQEAQVRILQAVRPQKSFKQRRHAGNQLRLLLDEDVGILLVLN